MKHLYHEDGGVATCFDICIWWIKNYPDNSFDVEDVDERRRIFAVIRENMKTIIGFFPEGVFPDLNDNRRENYE